MLSSLPKLTDKNFVIAFFLPALLGSVAVAQVFPNASWSLALLSQVTSEEKSLADVALLVVPVWVLAVLLLTANHGLYRIIEGYLWPLSSLRFLRRKEESRFSSLKDEYERLQAEWTDTVSLGTELSPCKKKRIADLSLARVSRFPSKLEEVMPTRFGNSIRAFEVYPREVYGADSISIWLRLASVIPKEFQTLVDDARAQVDFFVNSTFVSLGVASAALMWLVVQFVSATAGVRWLHSDWGASWFAFSQAFVANGCCKLAIVGTLSIGVCLLAYQCAVLRVGAWGDLVKSAFDCYLPALAEKLGYPLPSREPDRKEFWSDFSTMILYSQPMEFDRWIPQTIPSGDEHKANDGGNPLATLLKKIWRY
jgi:hypothetical protein